jgi:predicted alpha/beta hydrolase family esterase
MQQLQFERAILLRGSGKTVKPHWMCWLYSECKRSGLDTYFPKLREKNVPRLSVWLDALERHIKLINERTVLVAHSIGCATALQILQQHPEIGRVGSVILVSPSSVSRSESNDVAPAAFREFYGGLINDHGTITIKAVQSLGERMIHTPHVFASDNDTLVNPSEAKALSAILGAQFHLMPGAGHINVRSGHCALPEVLEIILKLNRPIA